MQLAVLGHLPLSAPAARQACRPKHQVLVLKCYPKVQKNNADAKANSSELSYLLYYASTRRSKLQKVVDFLDKRATKDVWKVRTGNVQVTLQIVKAVIEKCPRDLPLYAGAVLHMLRTILNSNNVTMVEESVPAFEALCAHQEPAALAADQDYIKKYEETVQLYAQFASKDAVKTAKAPVSWPVAIRYRKAGLQALNAVASSESLGSETGRQLAVVIPVILLNVHSESGAYLKRLEAREAAKGEHEKDLAARRRQSVSTARTDDDDGDPVAASGTTEDADKLAEEEVGVLALHALRSIFQGVNRGQLRLATTAVLHFITDHVESPEQTRPHQVDHWATTLMAMICAWVPVQDRYTVLVRAVEALVQSPIVDEDLQRQLLLATVIDYLLASTINFIGLSVMDVLVGLISHSLLLLQLGGPGSSITPHPQQTTSLMSEKEAGHQATGNNLAGVVMEVANKPSEARLRLMDTVQKCMADLATHVYYTDQISDMVEAILSRLKPSRFSSISSTAEAIQNPEGAVEAVADSVSMQEKTHVDRFFSFETARITALEAVKAIIRTANAPRPDGFTASVSRSKVGVSVWEGTQWLLRDPSGQVRKAYVDALVTWLNTEKDKEDLKIVDNYRRKEKDNEKNALARRAASNASAREKAPRRGKDTFLPLLHLAVYENALFYIDSEADYLLLHLLLTTLVNRLGVNAARSGLPMIMRLQEDIVAVEDPAVKLRMGSLVHGYLWALSMALDFEVTSVGRALHNEITRRNQKGLWMTSIRVPPMPIDLIETPHPTPAAVPPEIVQNESLRPFDNREALVEKISEGYSTSLHSPPSSPPGSPPHTMPISSSIPTIHQPVQPANHKDAPELPFKVREDLLSDWTRDVCLAAHTKDSSSASISGSRSGTHYTKNNFLGVNIPNGNLDSGTNSPVPSPRRTPSKPRSAAYGLVGRLSSPNRSRSPGATPNSSSSLRSTVRVDDLRRALSTSHGGAPRTGYSHRAPSFRHHESSSDHASTTSDSLVSVHSLSDASFITTNPTESQQLPNADSPTTPAATSTPRPLTASSTHTHQTRENAYTMNNLPPVPPIPEDFQNGNSDTRDFARPKTAPNGSATRKSRSIKSGVSRGRSGDRRRGSEAKGSLGSKPDFSGFLDSIGVGDEDEGENGDELAEGEKGVGKAPY
ncbi:efr3 [Pyrenophora seminiperda CCB06]|uniref:Efr3 n=1 Tax=Pyrenophora seminiperda CCB06 TaxID=1302712 RepID=A0A3M7LYG4_9PLEO|nr:efr3 [Pyrenophora seminiperda CCB06]